jgi:NADH dehydrogenase (ubiquinone) 1 alpha subcomplex subunit 9
MFGFEDNLLLKLASVMNLFTANNMQERYWPVHVSVCVATPLRTSLTGSAGQRCG